MVEVVGTLVVVFMGMGLLNSRCLVGGLLFLFCTLAVLAASPITLLVLFSLIGGLLNSLLALLSLLLITALLDICPWSEEITIHVISTAGLVVLLLLVLVPRALLLNVWEVWLWEGSIIKTQPEPVLLNQTTVTLSETVPPLHTQLSDDRWSAWLTTLPHPTTFMTAISVYKTKMSWKKKNPPTISLQNINNNNNWQLVLTTRLRQRVYSRQIERCTSPHHKTLSICGKPCQED